MPDAPRPDPITDSEIERQVKEGTEALLARVVVAFSSQDNWADQLRAVAYEMLDFLREDPIRARIMIIDVLDSTREAIAIREQGIAALTALIDAGRTELADPDSVPASVAAITAGAIYNQIHLAIERDELETRGSEMVPELMYTAVLPYLGIEAALAELKMPRPPA
jgi:hypothetical protein